jgi:hypothetical protein
MDADSINPKKIKYNMTASRVLEVFGYVNTKRPQQSFLIDKLLEENLIKFSGQYYKPTQKLLEIAFLPKEIKITKQIRQVLTQNEVFTKDELLKYFDDGYVAEAIIFWLKEHTYFYQSSDCRWRKTEKINELLADGVEEIQTN